MIILLAPIAVVVLFVLGIIALLRKAWLWASLWLILGLGLNIETESFALHGFGKDFKAQRLQHADDVLRVMSYNVWHVGPYMKTRLNQPVPELAKSLDSLDLDILYLTELYPNECPALVDTLLERYPFSTYRHEDNPRAESIQLFSRYPIEHLRKLCYIDTAGVESRNVEAWMMEILTPQGRVNVVPLHIATNDYGSARDKVVADSGSWWSGRREYFAGLQKGYRCRHLQADALADSLDQMEGPILVLGDFNDIGGSYAVMRIQGALGSSSASPSRPLADAWWKGGFGFGFTYDEYHLKLRLDHILYSERDFSLRSVKVFDDWGYSDHYPIAAELRMESQRP